MLLLESRLLDGIPKVLIYLFNKKQQQQQNYRRGIEKFYKFEKNVTLMFMVRNEYRKHENAIGNGNGTNAVAEFK